VQQLAATVRALTPAHADGEPAWLRPLDILAKMEAIHSCLLARARGDDLDPRAAEVLTWYDALEPLSAEYEAAVAGAVERFKPPPPPEPKMPTADELAVAEAEARGADTHPLPAPEPALLPKPAPPAEQPGVIRTGDGSILVRFDMQPRGPERRPW
jgi:hypothetical protein